MNTTAKRTFTFLLALALSITLLPHGMVAAEEMTLSSVMEETAQYLLNTVKSPQISSIGGDWTVFGLARSGYAVDDRYYQEYYAAVEGIVKAREGVLHQSQYTEYSRVILALTAIGKDPSDIAGYDLLIPLGDFVNVSVRGVNGTAYALMALDSASYFMPQNAAAQIKATRQMYVDHLLRSQREDGGFSIFDGTASETDTTAVVLQALANYQADERVVTAIDKALTYLSNIQQEDGTFANYGTVNAESVAQVLVALCSLEISTDDTRFVKNGKTVVDALLSFYHEGGGFRHMATGISPNLMATEQSFYALVALMRMENGESSLYTIDDPLQIPEATEPFAPEKGLPNKDPSVCVMPLVMAGKTFEDIAQHPNQAAIEALAERKIVNGMTETIFDPDATMTRAEFCTIVVNALGLTPKARAIFTDVPQGSWYEGSVAAAYDYGIVTGTSATTFHPGGTITKQEAAVMVMRAAKLTGMDTQRTAAQVRGMLSQFIDYTTSAAWAREGLAFCYEMDFFDQADIEISPLLPITRGEMAEILFRLLEAARLL